MKSFEKKFELHALITVLFFIFPLLIGCCTFTSSSGFKGKFNPPDVELNIEGLNPSMYSLNETIVIVVENSLWGVSVVQTAVNQYILDLQNTGFTTILYTNAISTVQSLKSLLQSWYTSYSISGAALIGNLPYAQYYHPAITGFSAETFICDLYLMDLDGNWWDLNTDGVYDKHNASGGGDIFPEIYIGRIDATNRVLGGQSNSQDIVTVLNRFHSYRIGGVSRSHKAITYIDDDWQPWANTWSNWLSYAYSNRDDINTPKTWTNSTDWLNNRLVQDYEFAHICVHSGAGPGMHYFGPGGSGEGTISSTQIHNKGPTFNFYNLFCCHGADWITSDCLATTYLYSGSRSISVIGSTKTGGMLEGSYFYNSLGSDNSIGKGLHDWFQFMTSYSSNYVEWFYGMSIIGDPFATIDYDCTIFTPRINSSTHFPANSLSSNKYPHFDWTIPVDVNGITGYYYIIDQNPSTIPNQFTGNFSTANGVNITSPLADGTWYLHVVAKDGAGNIGTYADHYAVQIYTPTPPPPSIPGFPLLSLISVLLLISVIQLYLLKKEQKNTK
ncbi:MAG: hypothetical protein EU542_03650 [Promethearchaeota archaeon]|nr:MAG: hypothetical protein EU542_03650 [Candidatus Lokiarchaeota archaeon]